LSGNPADQHNEDLVWTRMLNEVQADGSLPGELSRGQRSLEYHIRTVDGILILRTVRSAIGEHDHPESGASLRRLLAFIGDCLCDPGKMTNLAGVGQETPGEWGFRILYSFGEELISESFKSCGPQIKSWGNGEYGGDARLAVKAVHACKIQS
jgi:hypothetical protein